MSKPLAIHWTSMGPLCGLVGLALIVDQAQAQYDPGWTKNFRVGALTGLGIKGQIKLRGSFAVNGSDPGAGIYDDGYVRTDDTGNAGGYTSFWGYQNTSQYDSGSQTLQMHSSSSFTANGTSKLDQQFTAGVELAYGNKLKQWGRTSLGWEFGFGYLPISLKSDTSTAISGSVVRSTFSFNTGGIIMPGAPYNGGPSGIGATIHDTVTPVSSDTVPGTIREMGDLDANMFTFRLGPTLFYDVSPQFGLSGGIGPAFGIVSETCRFKEKIVFGDGTTAQAKGNFGATDLVYGAYLNLIATYHADDNGDIYIGVQYMPMSGSTFSKDGREASLDFTGQVYFMLGVNWTF